MTTWKRNAGQFHGSVAYVASLDGVPGYEGAGVYTLTLDGRGAPVGLLRPDEELVPDDVYEEGGLRLVLYQDQHLEGAHCIAGSGEIVALHGTKLAAVLTAMGAADD